MVLERYNGRVALVTGAATGVGAAIAQELQKQGMIVVGMARRVCMVKALSVPGAPGKIHSVRGDVTKEQDILDAFKWIRDNLGGVDVLVNSAAIFRESPLTSASTSDWKDTINVNILGLSICTREAVRDMLEREIDDGYIIHVNSVAAHRVPPKSSYAMYYASRHAIRALSEGLRRDLIARNSNIRNSTVSPGFVKSEGITDNAPFLEPADVAAAVTVILSQPLRVQIHDIILTPTGADM